MLRKSFSYLRKSQDFVLTTKWFKNITDQQLRDPIYLKQIIQKPFPHTIPKQQLGLFQGKRVASVQRTCFSQKKHRDIVRPHSMVINFQSSALGKIIRLHVSNKARRTINKMGGFQNYILASSPRVLKSKMGQYFRTLLYRKLIQPDFFQGYVLKTKQRQSRKKIDRVQRDLQRRVILPLEAQVADHSKTNFFRQDLFTRKQYQEFKEIQSSQNPSEAIMNHPIMRQYQELKAKQIALLEPQSKKIQSYWRARKADKTLINHLYDNRDKIKIDSFTGKQTVEMDPRKIKKNR